MAHIIVVGNEKGGAGKSTVSMHVATALARMGHNVSALDLDLRQKTFGRYAHNRTAYLAKEGLDLPGPHYHDLPEVDPDKLKPGENVYDRRLSAAVAELEPDSDFIVIDCPGSHTRLSQVAHSLADTLVTPSTTASSISTSWRMSTPTGSRSWGRPSIPKWSGTRGSCARRPG